MNAKTHIRRRGELIQTESGLRRQRGITLVMVLIFITTLSLVAAVSMRSIVTGDRVVANELDRGLAFQAAESAGRQAVASITAGTHTSPAAGYVTTHYALGGNTQFWQTTSNLTEATSCSPSAGQRFNWTGAGGVVCYKEATQSFLPAAAAGVTTYSNTVRPRYVIERMPAQLASPSTTDCWYRITSRATGGTGQADVILQVMFANTITNAIANSIAACN